uniref:ShKT domain-containing protein n=1 Tax=Megaselia scalaris TaxID=36166 RepID=T1GHM0_MEGSC
MSTIFYFTILLLFATPMFAKRSCKENCFIECDKHSLTCTIFKQSISLSKDCKNLGPKIFPNCKKKCNLTNEEYSRIMENLTSCSSVLMFLGALIKFATAVMNFELVFFLACDFPLDSRQLPI